jgi:hypothetical protein
MLATFMANSFDGFVDEAGPSPRSAFEGSLSQDVMPVQESRDS